MKKLLFVLVALLVGWARADNIVTSREYVDSQANTLQSELPAKNTNTVLLNTDTAGMPGEKAIYDASADYAAQSEALVTAGQFNTAVQNALESEFVCIERQNGNGGCLLYEIRGATQTAGPITGYTQLEYIESTGTQWIDTTYVPTNDTYLQIKYKTTQLQTNLAAAATPIGGRVAWLDRNFGVFSPVNRSTDVYMYAGNTYVQTWIPTLNKEVTAIIDPKNRYWLLNVEGDTYNSTKGVKPVTYVYPLYMFQLNNGGNVNINDAHIRIYYTRLQENGVLVHNFIPARRNSDGELGMYDTVTNSFFTNSGTGDFIAGPVVYF